MCTSHIERYLIIEKTFGSTAVCRGGCRPNVAGGSGGGGHSFFLAKEEACYTLFVNKLDFSSTNKIKVRWKLAPFYKIIPGHFQR